jgi:hypothetical protein
MPAPARPASILARAATTATPRTCERSPWVNWRWGWSICPWAIPRLVWQSALCGGNEHATPMVARPARTGRKDWLFQTRRNDVWGHDLGGLARLIDLPAVGATVPAMALSTYQGAIHAVPRRALVTVWRKWQAARDLTERDIGHRHLAEASRHGNPDWRSGSGPGLRRTGGVRSFGAAAAWGLHEWRRGLRPWEWF